MLRRVAVKAHCVTHAGKMQHDTPFFSRSKLLRYAESCARVTNLSKKASDIRHLATRVNARKIRTYLLIRNRELGRAEERKRGREEETSARGAVHSCISRVLPCVAHSFCAMGSPCVTSHLRTAQRIPCLRAWHTVSPCADQLPSTNTKGSRVLLSSLVWFSAALQCVVLDTRVQAA